LLSMWLIFLVLSILSTCPLQFNRTVLTSDSTSNLRTAALIGSAIVLYNSNSACVLLVWNLRRIVQIMCWEGTSIMTEQL
jgi:hypothetical protein